MRWVTAFVLIVLPFLANVVGFYSFTRTTTHISAIIIAAASAATSAAAVVILDLDPEGWRAQLYPNIGIISLIGGLLTFPYWYWYASTAPPVAGEFYSTVAQVIPVLLLTAVVDLRTGDRPDGDQQPMLVGIVAVGEFFALYAIAYELRFAAIFAIVSSSIIASLIGLLIAVFSPPRRGDRD
jgi:hypothetical protein